ncbi:hypothetical protein [Streptomyces canus]|nr:hypothetical protein [Streptomyces canus]MCX4853914.1 hypothetical protein [Streptomyces canus]
MVDLDLGRPFQSPAQIAMAAGVGEEAGAVLITVSPWLGVGEAQVE